jgi:hypothetical protein
MHEYMKVICLYQRTNNSQFQNRSELGGDSLVLANVNVVDSMSRVPMPS